jgi:hypothetical protein
MWRPPRGRHFPLARPRQGRPGFPLSSLREGTRMSGVRIDLYFDGVRSFPRAIATRVARASLSGLAICVLLACALLLASAIALALVAPPY